MKCTKHAKVNKTYIPENETRTIHFLYHAETFSWLTLRIALVSLRFQDKRNTDISVIPARQDLN